MIWLHWLHGYLKRTNYLAIFDASSLALFHMKEDQIIKKTGIKTNTTKLLFSLLRRKYYIEDFSSSTNFLAVLISGEV